MDYKRYVKGGIWWYQQNYLKNDQDNYFPIIIVSEASDPCGKCMVTIVPIKPVRIVNQNELDLQYVVPITIKEAGYIMCNELKTISTDKLDQYEGQCTQEKMNAVDKIISQYLNLSLFGISADNTATNTTTDTATKVENKSTQKTSINTKSEMKEEKKKDKSVQPKYRKRSNFKKEIPDELDLTTPINTDNSLNNQVKSTVSTTTNGTKNKARKSYYKPVTDPYKNGRGPGHGIPVYCVTTQKWYVSMYEAQKSLNVDYKKLKASLEKSDGEVEVDGYTFSFTQKPKNDTVKI